MVRLKSLDAYLTSKIEEHKKEHDEIFYTGLLTLKTTSPKLPRLPQHHAVQTQYRAWQLSSISI